VSGEGEGEKRVGELQDGEVFQALAHRVRRAIIRSLAEKGERSFTELMRDARLEDSSVMAFHMKKLDGLVRRNERGYYELTDLGWRAYKVLRELELESLRDRAEEVLKEIKGKEQVTKEVSRPGPQAVSAGEEGVKGLTPTDILKEVLGGGRVWVDRSAPPAPNVKLEVIGSDITLTGTVSESIRVQGTARRESDATISTSRDEARITVKGMDGEVSVPEVNRLEILVKGGDLTARNLKLPPNVSMTVLGGDISMNAVMRELSNLSASVKGGDVLANILVEEVRQGASVSITALGGDAHITLRVPRNTKVVKGNIKAAGGDVGIEVDESLSDTGEDVRTLVINAKVIGGDASIKVTPKESGRPPSNQNARR